MLNRGKKKKCQRLKKRKYEVVRKRVYRLGKRVKCTRPSYGVVTEIRGAERP
jgi:hypothetical protein